MNHPIIRYHHQLCLHLVPLMIYYKCLLLIDLITFVVYFVHPLLMFVMFNASLKLVVQWFDFVINNKKFFVNYQSIISRLISINLDWHSFVRFSLAVANTDLIRYFLVYEPKLRSLLHTIRLWIKQKDLLGKGHRFNTYTIFWMIVCMLQVHDKHLPSVQSLVQLASKSQ